MKRDYIEVMQKPDSRTAVGNLTIAFAHYMSIAFLNIYFNWLQLKSLFMKFP